MSDAEGNGPAACSGNRQWWIHRQALQVTSELPDDLEEALAVLDRARYLLLLCQAEIDRPADANVVQLKPKLVAVSE